MNIYKHLSFVGWFLPLFFFLSGMQVHAQNYVAYYQQGQEALKQENYELFRDSMIKADSARPNHPVIMYNLAKAYAMNNEDDPAFQTLFKLSHFYASENVLDSTDFTPLLGSVQWDNLSREVGRFQEETGKSIPAFSFNKTGFHAEGITFDPHSSRFFITDIRNGLIYRLDEEGRNPQQLTDLGEAGYWSAMGISPDPKDPDILWVTTSAMVNFAGYTEDAEGKAALLKIDKHSGEVQKVYTAEEKEDGHILGDLIVTSGGTVYISDSVQPVIYKLDDEKGELVPAFTYNRWWNLQGLALSDDERFLYASDYILGIFRIDRESGSIHPLIDEGEWLRGGDGIYQKSGTLVVLQNGTTPKRVARIKLNQEGLGIPESLEFTDAARPEMEEPTLGTWVNSDLYYIANSPWAYYSDAGDALLDEWPELQILRLSTETR